MYPELNKDCIDFEKVAGKSINILIKLKSFKLPIIGNYWHTSEFWTADNIQGEIKDSDIEEWYYLPIAGTGNKV